MSRLRQHQALVLGLSLLLSMLVVLPSAWGDSVGRLIRILRKEGSYKVRLRAVITLTRQKDPRVPKALMKALKDSSHVVRGVAATALGKQHHLPALPLLRRMARRDSHRYSRDMAREAVASLRAFKRQQLKERRLARAAQSRAARAREQERKSKEKRVYLTFKPMHNRSRRGGKQAAQMLQQALEREFAAAPRITTHWEGSDKPTASALQQQRMSAFTVSGSIQRITHKRSGANVMISCAVRVELSTYPGNSLKAFYSGESAMEVPARGLKSALNGIYRDIFDGAAREASKHIVQRYLSLQ